MGAAPSKKGGRGGGNGTSQPQALRASIQVDKVVRFKNTAALSNVSVIAQDLLDLFCVATSAVAAYGLATSVKVRKLEMWVDPVAGGSFCSIEDLTNGNVGAPSRIKEDTTLGVTRPAHLVWKPATGSLQSLWCNQGVGGKLFELNSSGAGYVDVHYSFVLQDGETPIAVGAVVAGATVGQLYCRALNSSTGTNLLPVSYPTI